MRDQLSRKTLVPAKRKCPHGRMAIVGRLVMLSGFLLVCGVTSVPAQTGQDPRCEEFSGQAKGLCTAAVSNGCFEGVQSPDCDALTTNWNEHCRECAGEPPWEVRCPCANAAVGGVTWDPSFHVTDCTAGDPVIVSADGASAAGIMGSIEILRDSVGDPGLCGVHALVDGVLRFIHLLINTPAEGAACVASLRSIALADGITCP
jgi:hypothetical protein